MTVESKSEETLKALRLEIDHIDRQLFSLLAQRMEVVKEIAQIKCIQGLSINDPVREALLKEKLKKFSADVLEPWHVEELTSVILRISRDIQSKESKD